MALSKHVDKDTDTIKDLKCPLCNNPLARNDYNAAVREMETQAVRKADEKLNTKVKAHQHKLDELKESHQQEINERRNDQKTALAQQRTELLENQKDRLDDTKRDRDAIIRNLKKEHQQETFKMRRELTVNERHINASLKKDLKEKEKQLATQAREMTRKHAVDMASSKREIQALEKETHTKYSDDLAVRDKKINQLKKNLISANKTAKDDARVAVNNEIERQEKNHENDISDYKKKLEEKRILLDRTTDELNNMKKKLEQSPSELQGEAGERDLRRVLEAAFPYDHFETQTRGTSSSDLIQHIKLPSGKFGTPIVYDNKAGSGYSKIDIKKATEYKRTHGTEYSLIVSSKPQKKSVPNGLLGEVNGVIVVHPSIVIEVAKTIREGIVKIARVTTSQNDKDAKQGRLYKYVVGHEFTEIMKSLEAADKEMDELQVSEEKAHKILWTRRKSVVSKQRKAQIDLSGGIDAIIQSEILLENLYVRSTSHHTGMNN